MSDNNYMNSPAAIQFGRGLIGKTIKPITWHELYTLRNNNNLQQGTTYRITDYHCTSMDDNTKSAGHRFDILVTALDSKTLSEIGRAMKHDFTDDEIDPLTGAVYTQAEKDYFNDIPIEAWEVHYCIDNDQQRFNWAVPNGNYQITTDVDTRKLAYNSALTTTLGISGKYALTNVVGNSSYTQCYLSSKNPSQLTTGDTIELYDITNSTVLSTETISTIGHCGIALQISTITVYYGRGVIYRLIDENNNDVCYDFKNILFKRDADWRTTYSGYYDTNVFNSEHEWFYTFVNNNNDISVTESSNCIANYIQGTSTLPNIVMDLLAEENNLTFCKNITIHRPLRNTGKEVHDIVFKANCNHNYLNYVYNLFGGGTFGFNNLGQVNNYSVTNYFISNTIKNSHDVTCSGSFQYNEINGNFYSNNLSFCNSNTFNGEFFNNTATGTISCSKFSGNVHDNSFEYIGTNTVSIAYCTIGGLVNNNTFKALLRYVDISGAVGYTIFTPKTFNNAQVYVQDIHIAGRLQHCTITSGNAVNNKTNIFYIDIPARARLEYVNINTGDDNDIAHLNISAYIQATENSPVNITIPSNPNNRTINVDVDANGNPIIYFPSDQEELIENMTATTATLYPKRMYIWGTVASLDLSLASTGSSVVNEYHFRFTADSGMTLSLPSGITWAGGNVPPRTQGKTYEISIIDNYASYLEF